MLFFSSSVGTGFGGDYIYTKQMSDAISLYKDLFIIKIEHVKLEYIAIIFFMFPLLIFFPFMWRPMCRYHNIVSVLRNIKNCNDPIIIDHFRNAWIVLLCLLFKDKKIIIITHNIEHLIAKECYLNKSIYIRFFYYFEYLKIKFWENIIFNYVDALTTITEEDAANINEYSEKVLVIKPYYENSNIKKSILLSNDEKCLIVGSFNWKIKQDNLLALLHEFKMLDKPKDFEIIIAGTMPDYLSTLIRNDFSFVKLRLNYPNIDYLMNISRLAIAPDQVGGGFKLKILDYFYLGLPVFGLVGSMNGINRNARGIKLFRSYTDLAQGVLKYILDQDKLLFMSKQNQSLLSNSFDKENMVQQIRNLLNGKINT